MYENHPSIININNQNLTKRSHETDFTTTNQVKEVDQKTPASLDKKPPKILKLLQM